MSKKQVLWLLLDLVFLIVFNVVFFIIGGFKHNLSVWISYGFIHFSYIMLLITPFFVRKTKNTAVLSSPLYAISSAFFLITFLVGLVFIYAYPVSFKVSVVVHIIIFGIYASMLISHMLANESTADSIEQHEKELQYVKKSSAKLRNMIDYTDDKETKKELEKLYDLLHSSPAKSNNSVRSLETSVLSQIDILNEYLNDGAFEIAKLTIKKIENDANERNRKLKYNG